MRAAPGLGVGAKSAIITATMSTTAQCVANHANALKSSGPRSSEGRAVSAMNGRKHGLRAESAALLPSESREHWNQLVLELRNDLQPEGEVEELLVERVACATWKLRRAAAFETGALIAEDAEEIGTGKAAWRDMNKGQTLQLVVKYTKSAEASMYAALHELERRKARRALPAGGTMPVPVAVDLVVIGDAPEPRKQD
jgi:hypothetical protein